MHHLPEDPDAVDPQRLVEAANRAIRSYVRSLPGGRIVLEEQQARYGALLEQYQEALGLRKAARARERADEPEGDRGRALVGV
ncbi:hypothetical protein [Streptacidiphilus carbonis]|uniref:hypothetical protein n=1 Tax=Streptacidiphilus carbonis TaxID=105422 RepID=UPI0005A8F512|nr:hypothetical protein [Streptacidiphilus carbonis]